MDQIWRTWEREKERGGAENGGTFFVLDLCFDIVNGVRGLDLERDGLPGEGFDKDLHLSRSISLLRLLSFVPAMETLTPTPFCCL